MTGDDTVIPPPFWPGDTSHDHPSTVLPSSCPRHQNVGTYKDGLAKIRWLLIDGESYKLNILLNNSCDTLAAFIMNQGHICCQSQPHCILKNSLLECTLFQYPWEQSNDLQRYVIMDTWESNHINDCDPSSQPNLLPQSTTMIILLTRWLCMALSKQSTMRQCKLS
jgi:hypothetical protein